MKLSHFITLLLLVGVIAVARADEDSAQSGSDDGSGANFLSDELGDGSTGSATQNASDGSAPSPGDSDAADVDAKIAEVKGSIQELKKKKAALKESGAKELERARAGTPSSLTSESSSGQPEEASEKGRSNAGEHADQQEGSTTGDGQQKESASPSTDSSSDIEWNSWFDKEVAPSLDSAEAKDGSSEDASTATGEGKNAAASTDSGSKDADANPSDVASKSADGSSEDNWSKWFDKEVVPSLDNSEAKTASGKVQGRDGSSEDNWSEWFDKEVAPSLDKTSSSSGSCDAKGDEGSSEDNWWAWFDKEITPSLDKSDGKSSSRTSTEAAAQNAIEVAKLRWRIEMSKGNITPNTTNDITTQSELSKLKKKEAELAARSKDLLMREATTSTPPPNAAAKGYDREAAVAYASKFWNSKLRINHDCSQAYHLCTPYAFYGSGCSYPIAHGGDTANFVSQALLAGSHPALSKGECRGVCGAEPNMRRRVSCLTTHYGWSRVCGYNAAIPDGLRAGDIIAYHDNRGCSSEPVHMALVVRVENGFAYVTSHDEDVQGQNHQFFYPKGKYVSYLHYNG